MSTEENEITHPQSGILDVITSADGSGLPYNLVLGFGGKVVSLPLSSYNEDGWIVLQRGDAMFTIHHDAVDWAYAQLDAEMEDVFPPQAQ